MYALLSPVSTSDAPHPSLLRTGAKIAKYWRPRNKFEEFVDFNDDVVICGDLTDEDILASVQLSNFQDEADEDYEEDARAESDQTKLSTKDTREAIDVRLYLTKFERKC
ncbi:hypothetical protein J6590_036296 [Homalodisca vitripennis]|nr:hypothetical protein J6590_036296 [Homalodisca vitripennis]